MLHIGGDKKCKYYCECGSKKNCKECEQLLKKIKEKSKNVGNQNENK